MSEVKSTQSPLTNSVTEQMSRHELLEWVNSTVHGQYKKIEELCSGVAYCQLIELIFPQSIGMKKVKMSARLEHEYLHNLKLIQLAFARLKIEKSVPIDRLIKGRFQDNFEFLQWFKKFFDTHAAGKENLKVPAALAAAAANAPKPVRRPGTGTLVGGAPVLNAGSGGAKAKTTPTGGNDKKPQKTSTTNGRGKSTSISPSSLRVLEQAREQLAEQINTVQYDRDYYYNKLIGIEALLKESADKNEHTEWCKRALAILYAADDSNGGKVESTDF